MKETLIDNINASMNNLAVAENRIDVYKRQEDGSSNKVFADSEGYLNIYCEYESCLLYTSRCV